jgi:DNA-binding NtrC family response regulator
MRTLRILYVDDELPLLELMRRVLNRAHYEVITFTDPREALQELQANTRDFDVLLTDVNMPGLSGFALIEEARKYRPNLPALIVTGYLSPEDLDRASQLGDAQIMQKSSSIDAYLGELLNLLSRYR